MFNQVNLTGIVKSCNSVSFNGQPASAFCVEVFGDSSSVYMISFKEILAEPGDTIAVMGSLTTRKFEVQDGTLIESDQRGYLRVLVDEYQIQKRSVKTDDKQQLSTENPADGKSLQSNDKDKNIVMMENLTLVKKEDYSVWFAGYTGPFTITKRTQNVALLDVQQNVNAIVYIQDKTGKMYLNEITPVSKDVNQTGEEKKESGNDSISVINGASVEAINDFKVKFAGYDDEFGMTKRTKNRDLLTVGSWLKLIVYTDQKTGKRYLNEVHEPSISQSA